MTKRKTTNAFLVMWDMYGLEAVQSISRYEDWEKEQLIELLKNKKASKNPVGQILNMWQFRARFNGQRHYEIWAIDCEDKSIDEDWWVDSFEANPQAMVDLVRSKGVCFWNGRTSTREQRIV